MRPPTSQARSRSPASARARCRARCCSRTSARTGSGSRPSSRTSAAGSGTPPRARASAPSRPPSTTSSCPRARPTPWSFSATVEVQPTPEIVDWTTLEVPRAETVVPEELVQAEIDALRGSIAELVPADDRPAGEGDTVVVDLSGADGTGQSDTVVELGSGRLVPEIECALVGASVGDTRTVRYELADGRRDDRRRHRQACQREGAARGRRRARALGQRVRHARRPPRGHRGPRPRSASRSRSTPRSARPRSTSSSAPRTCRARDRSSSRARASS